MDWINIQQVGNVLITVDAEFGWTEAFVCRDRPPESVIKCVSSVFVQFGVPYSLVSGNAKEFTNGKITQWLEIRGCEKTVSPLYAP